MFLRVRQACWRQLLQFSPGRTMFCKMCVTVALCLSFLAALSEGFFVPLSLRKQAPQATNNAQQWIPSPGIATSNGPNTIQPGFLNPKDFNPYAPHQQQPQSVAQQQPQQQQPPLHLQGAYSSQLYTVQTTAPKYDPVPFQSANQPQYAYEGAYSSPLNSYPQSVQLVPCLCPVNKEVMEQQSQQVQQQQQQQSSVAGTPPSAGFGGEATPPSAQGNQKKVS